MATTASLERRKNSALLSAKEFEKSGLCEIIIKEIINGASENEARTIAGISKNQFLRYKQSDYFLSLIARAKAQSKMNLVGAATTTATKGYKVKDEIKTFKKIQLPDGSMSEGMVCVDIKEITREIPPDGKVAIQLLKARFPEEFGDIRRIDLTKIGHESQVDLESIPTMKDSPKQVLDMILNGDGTYELQTDDFEEDEIDTLEDEIQNQPVNDGLD